MTSPPTPRRRRHRPEPALSVLPGRTPTSKKRLRPPQALACHRAPQQKRPHHLRFRPELSRTWSRTALFQDHLSMLDRANTRPPTQEVLSFHASRQRLPPSACPQKADSCVSASSEFFGFPEDLGSAAEPAPIQEKSAPSAHGIGRGRARAIRHRALPPAPVARTRAGRQVKPPLRFHE